jgi:hypothetical protein
MDYIINEFPIKFQDQFIYNKNIDRSKFYKNPYNENEIYSISACYHLDKFSGKKSGGFFSSQIINNEKSNNLKIKKEYNFHEVNYGILEFKLNKEKNMIFTSNSDCSFSIFKINLNEKVYNNNDNERYNLSFELKKNQIICQEKSNEENCGNFIEINNFNDNSEILLTMNNGDFYLYDYENEKIVFEKNAHDYGIWSSLILEENTFLTGSEDSYMKMWDKRTKEL